VLRECLQIVDYRADWCGQDLHGVCGCLTDHEIVTESAVL